MKGWPDRLSPAALLATMVWLATVTVLGLPGCAAVAPAPSRPHPGRDAEVALHVYYPDDAFRVARARAFCLAMLRSDPSPVVRRGCAQVGIAAT